MFELELAARSKLFSARASLLDGAADNPVGPVIDILRFTGDADEVCRTTMAPPELARNAPVLNAL